MSDQQRPEWAIAAAEEITNGEGLSALTAYTSVVAIGIIAEIIARHAPQEPTAIGPGDVVQMVPGCSVDPCEITIVKPSNFGESDFVALSTSGVCSWRPCHKSHLIRIGRAKYWPDGSPVESDK